MEHGDDVRSPVASIRSSVAVAASVGLLLATTLDPGDSVGSDDTGDSVGSGDPGAAGDSGDAGDSDDSEPTSVDGPDADETSGHLLLDAEDRVLEVAGDVRRLLAPRSVETGAALSSVLPEATPVVSDRAEGRAELTVETDVGRRTVDAQWCTFSGAYEGATRVLVLRDPSSGTASTGRYRELVENAYELCLILDPDGRITFAAPSVERILGFDPDVVVGNEVFEHLHPADRDEVRAQFEALLDAPDATRRFEYRTQNHGGEWRVFEGVAWNALETPDVEGVVVNALDVTERRRREHELERRNEQLEEFAGVVSHDLRNPLQVASGHLERAEATGDPAAFEHVRTAHDRMEAIIEDVLELARQGETVEETEAIALEAVAPDAWETADTKETTLTVEGDRKFEGDRQRVRQLLENLFRNAADHAGRDADVFVGPIEPFHTSTRIEGQGRRGFYVSDDGPGIPEDDREAVFESGVTTSEDGIGFGLAIVERIADAHRWDVTVTASNYGGARFEFTEDPDDAHLRPG